MANATYEAVTGTDRANFASYVNIVGSVISLAVFVVIFGWGIQTILRDSSGVPVVRALDGPVRIAPEVPGGLQKNLPLNWCLAKPWVLLKTSQLLTKHQRFRVRYFPLVRR